MKKSALLLTTFFFSVCAAAADMNTPVGKWKTIDDESGKPKSIVEITEVNGKLEGKIVKLFRAPTEEQNPLCDKCDGERHNKPLIGLNILWDMKKLEHKAKWDEGHILDPHNGKTYHCQLWLKDEGKSLVVRGYIGGISLLGRSQTWERQ